MSSRTETWVAGIVGVAVGAALAVTIFLVSQPPANREQATGAIGAAERFRTEQIKEGDTGIAGEQAAFTGGAVTVEQFADLLGKAPSLGEKAFRGLDANKQVEMLGSAPDDLLASMLDFADLEVRSEALSRASNQQRRDMALRMPETDLQRALERVNVDAGRFAQMTPQERGNAFNELSRYDQVIALKFATNLEKASLVKAMPVEKQQSLVERATAEDCARVLANASKEDRLVALRALSRADHARLLENAPHEMQKAYLGRVPWSREFAGQLANVATVQEKATSLGYGSADAIAEALGRADENVVARVVDHSSNAERIAGVKAADEVLLAKAFATMGKESQLAAFASLDTQGKTEALAAMHVSEAEWAKMTHERQAERLADLDGRTQARVILRADPSSMLQAFNALDARQQFEALRVGGLGAERAVARCDAGVKAAVFDAATLEGKAEFLRGNANLDLGRMVERFPDLARNDAYQKAYDQAFTN